MRTWRTRFSIIMSITTRGRPIVLAGFSQGAELSLRLLEECFDEEELNRQLAACYAIGWSITEEELKEHPHMKFAEGETDTGVIVRL